MVNGNLIKITYYAEFDVIYEAYVQVSSIDYIINESGSAIISVRGKEFMTNMDYEKFMDDLMDIMTNPRHNMVYVKETA